MFVINAKKKRMGNICEAKPKQPKGCLTAVHVLAVIYRHAAQSVPETPQDKRKILLMCSELEEQKVAFV